MWSIKIEDVHVLGTRFRAAFISFRVTIRDAQRVYFAVAYVGTDLFIRISYTLATSKKFFQQRTHNIIFKTSEMYIDYVTTHNW